MRSYDIDSIKAFTTHLFAKETFDGYLVTEASFSTLVDFSIDGHINADFPDEEEKNLPEYREGIVFWKKLRPFCFEIVKGKRVPLRFKLVFKMPPEFVLRFLQEASLSYDAAQIGGLFLNVVFQDGKLSVTTGTSLKTFSMDKSLEHAWDEWAERFTKIS